MDMALHCPACQRDYSIMERRFACPARPPLGEGGAEHVLRQLFRETPSPEGAPPNDQTAPMGQDPGVALWRAAWDDGERGSFRVFRSAMSSHLLAGEQGYLAMLESLNENLLAYTDLTFEATPTLRARTLEHALGRAGAVFLKDETVNVAGSHKARHLMGTLLYLEAHRRLAQETMKTPLAVYGCGDAAVAAAVMARVGEYPLHCFVPNEVSPEVEDALRANGAFVNKVARTAGSLGDPCHAAYRQAVAEREFLPFACAGPENWSAIEGGRTLGYELAMQLTSQPGDATLRLDHMVLQVGGGAFARAVVEALESCVEWGLLPSLPRIHAAQPAGGFPFVRAYALLLAAVADAAGLECDLEYDPDGDPEEETTTLREWLAEDPEQAGAIAAHAREHFTSRPVQEVLTRAVLRPWEYMWPWDVGAPASLAHGILDDVTYDWFYLAAGMLRTGGLPVALEEDVLAQARELAWTQTTARPTATGAAGLAGLMTLSAHGHIAATEPVGLVFTGSGGQR